MNIYLDQFPELTKELNSIVKQAVNIELRIFTMSIFTRR